LHSNIAAFNGDPDQMYVVGHSAGGHLAAMLMATDWNLHDPNISANMIKGICTVSGLFNLLPIYYSYINKVVKMDMETATSNSPVMLEPLTPCPLIVAVGDAETTAFINQSNDFYNCWKKKGTNIQLLQLPRQNHYSIAEAIIDPQSALHQALLQMMNVN
jgi:arylformamidase